MPTLLNTPCELSAAPVAVCGYARVSVSGRGRLYAHRWAYELAFGPIPKGLQVCHKCDEPRCVNPDHLFLGTLRDNMADKFSKGRQAKGAQLSKLSEEDVNTIRASQLAQRELARLYKIDRSTVSRIKSGKRWGG